MIVFVLIKVGKKERSQKRPSFVWTLMRTVCGNGRTEMPEGSVLSRPRKAIFETGISLPLSKTGRAVQDSRARTSVVVLS